MDILYVTPTLPVPTSGGRTRVFNLIRKLAKSHRVSVISYVQPEEQEMISEIIPYCNQLELVPFEGFKALSKWQNRLTGWYRILFRRRPRYAETFPLPKMEAPLQRLIRENRFDVAVFESLLVAELSTTIQDIPAVLVEQNVESSVAKRLYTNADNIVHKLRDWLTWRKLLRYEVKWLRRFSVCVTVSEDDAEKVQSLAPKTDVYVVPNGVDIQHFTMNESERDSNTLLFFGTLNYGPNLDGLLWFCDEIWPRIQLTNPHIKLDIVGLNPTPEVISLEKLKGVHVTGFVPDIRTKLWSATIGVVPLRIGGGTRLKILESLATGCPVISTTIGAEGLSLVDGEHLLIRDTHDQFAQGVADLLDSVSLRKRLSKAGRLVVEQKYDWKHIGKLMEDACIQAIAFQNRM